jgi:hypothetical protein
MKRTISAAIVVLGASAALGAGTAGATSNACKGAERTVKRDEAKLNAALKKFHSDQVAGNVSALAKDEVSVSGLESLLVRVVSHKDHACA